MDSLEPSLQLTHKDVDDVELNDLNNTSTLTATMDGKEVLQQTYITSPHKMSAIPRMAERVKLKCASKNENSDTNITAMDLRNTEVCCFCFTKIVEIIFIFAAQKRQHCGTFGVRSESQQLLSSGFLY